MFSDLKCKECPKLFWSLLAVFFGVSVILLFLFYKIKTYRKGSPPTELGVFFKILLSTYQVNNPTQRVHYLNLKNFGICRFRSSGHSSSFRSYFSAGTGLLHLLLSRSLYRSMLLPLSMRLLGTTPCVRFWTCRTPFLVWAQVLLNTYI